ncbi:formate--tetrahydrofolate ligase [Robertkochia solimangrovi]|uniref:formate--tetrahydrofolate ligase n=1 Tax=Robertkochia solimangrovi TaxID=2213046 RepID=UPI00118019F5|nr:formate--tetrahydrofolate ligase [Robertkochia solimangrovi]TRZ42270.1 formate--tetrahydrofolate ligase [Robertkochia solimangrovi]
MHTDIEIATAADIKPIENIAQKLGILKDDLECYGKYKAKLPLSLTESKKVDESNLILVTAITPTPAGEGKTTISIGLADGLSALGKKTVAVLREPSLGPVFGIKGGAAGGGYSQVIPMEDINLHFTGDFNAIEKANNLLAALIDNNIQSKTRNLGIDPRTVLWKRCIDMNDRSLRNIISSLGGKGGGMPRETGFNITAASEIMAILCMSKDPDDLKERFGNIYIGDTFQGKPVYARDLNAEGAMAILMNDAIKPNLVQTLEGTPVLIHGGPFANIAQGTNSIIATRMGMSLADYVVTEAGFGADLGAEKFLNIKSRYAGISPKAVVIVATIRALKYHGGKPLKTLGEEDAQAVTAGMSNLERHVETIQKFGLPVIVSINKFTSDTTDEIAALQAGCKRMGVEFSVSNGFAEGSKGTLELAEKVKDICEGLKKPFVPTYDLEDSIEEKINKIATGIYGASGVNFTDKARQQLKKFESMGYGNYPVCMAKTQKSLSDNEKLPGRPENFTVTIREFEIAAGAGFLIPILGNMLRMPGLPETPAAENMDMDNNGSITGLS